MSKEFFNRYGSKIHPIIGLQQSRQPIPKDRTGNMASLIRCRIDVDIKDPDPGIIPLQGSIEYQGTEYPRWSTLCVGP